MRKRNILMVAGTCLAALALVAPSAIADPTNPPTFRALAGTGSDTSQDVLTGLANGVPALAFNGIVDGSGTRIVASYDASGSATITTKDPAVTPGCTFARPSGSTNGVRALRDQRTRARNGETNAPCLNFARSSVDSSTRPEFANTGLSYVVFARDGITYATRDDSAVSRNLSTTVLRQIYTCQLTPAQQLNFRPLIPQFGSGTRTFFIESVLGLGAGADTAAFVTQNPCVSERDRDGNLLLENTGTLLQEPRNIAPYSLAQYKTQITAIIPDVHGETILRNVNGILPDDLFDAPATFTRPIFNVIPQSQEAVAPTSTTFVGAGSAVCSNAARAVIERFGFGTAPNCGTIVSRTPGGPTTP